MCGFVGIIGNINQEDKISAKKRLTQSIFRGPDHTSCVESIDKMGFFGHNRLSIIDTSEKSNQPFISNSKNVYLIFNGAIYNYIELKKELIKYGHIFKTQGDTEVLMAAYLHWNEAFLTHINGMFSFAIYDCRVPNNPTLILGRDRAGEKPMYYSFNKKIFSFGSTLKSVCHSGSIDPDSLNFYLFRGYFPSDQSFVRDAKKLPPGNILIYKPKDSSIKVRQYWSIPKFLENNLHTDDIVNSLWELLKSSTELRLRSDVKNGIFLSGGLDSSLITAASAHVLNNLNTYTVTSNSEKTDESHHAKLIANHFSTNHTELHISDLDLNTLFELNYFLDEPIADPSILPTFMISRLASKHVSCILGGDGGDEIFAGYPEYRRAIKIANNLENFPKSFFTYFSKVAKKFPIGFKGRNLLLSLREGAIYFHALSTIYFDLDTRSNLIKNSYREMLIKELKYPERDAMTAIDHRNLLSSILKYDFKNRLADGYLYKVDRGSMSNSLEVRAPYLDHRLIDFSYRYIDESYKINKSHDLRFIQKKMAEKTLPQEFDFERKQGFSLSVENLIHNKMSTEMIMTLPSEIFDRKYLENLISTKNHNNLTRMFMLLQIAHFMEINKEYQFT